jgi:hypothetical protein
VAQHARITQPRQVRRDARLSDAGDAHELRHAELALGQQRAQPQPILVAQQAQRLGVGAQSHRMHP